MNPAGKFPTKSERIERLERELRIAKSELNSCVNDETPVTDSAAFEVLSQLQSGTVKVVRAELAQRFERELATAKSELEQFRKREHDRQIIRDSEALDRQDDLEAERRREANLRREIGLEW